MISGGSLHVWFRIRSGKSSARIIPNKPSNGRSPSRRIVANAQVLLEDRGHHHHAVIALGPVKLTGMLTILVVVPVRLELHALGNSIKSFKAFLQVEILGTTQPFGAKEVHQRDVALLQVVRLDRTKFLKSGGLLELL